MSHEFKYLKYKFMQEMKIYMNGLSENDKNFY